MDEEKCILLPKEEYDRLTAKKRPKKRRRKRHFADYIVYLSILAVVAYTVTAFVLQFKGLMEVSPTLTGAWYGFWTVEIVALATIKNCKTKHSKEKEEVDYAAHRNRFE